MSDFDMMDLPPKLVARLNTMGLKDPTPIQRQAIPIADCVAATSQRRPFGQDFA